MHYTTVSVGLVEGHEIEGINEAIKQGLTELSDEISGPVELASVAYVPIGEDLYVTVLAKKYFPPIVPLSGTSMQDTFRELLKRL
jgi:hypothetical protein